MVLPPLSTTCSYRRMRLSTSLVWVVAVCGITTDVRGSVLFTPSDTFKRDVVQQLPAWKADVFLHAFPCGVHFLVASRVHASQRHRHYKHSRW